MHDILLGRKDRDLMKSHVNSSASMTSRVYRHSGTTHVILAIDSGRGSARGQLCAHLHDLAHPRLCVPFVRRHSTHTQIDRRIQDFRGI